MADRTPESPTAYADRRAVPGPAVMPFVQPSPAEMAAAAAIVDSAPVISAYAACEWSELSEDGQVWVAAIVRATRARLSHPPQPAMGEVERLAVAKAIASKTYAFGTVQPEGSPQYDCGEWEDFGRYAKATYLDAADAALAALSQPPAVATPADDAGVRDGWKLVPVEPTVAMLDAALKAYSDRTAGMSDDARNRLKHALRLDWSAMLAASPKAPSVAIGAGEVERAVAAIHRVRFEDDGTPWDDDRDMARAAIAALTPASASIPAEVTLDNYMRITIVPGSGDVILWNEAGEPIASGVASASDSIPADVEREALRREIINTPETADFMAGVPLEAIHQRERWGSDHDAGKSPFDWFWLIGYLAQKAADAATRGDLTKAQHHTISTAAALANWHAALTGTDTSMRPGIEPPATQHPTGEKAS